eukprot:s1314_g4.t2
MSGSKVAKKRHSAAISLNTMALGLQSHADRVTSWSQRPRPLALSGPQLSQASHLRTKHFAAGALAGSKCVQYGYRLRRPCRATTCRQVVHDIPVDSVDTKIFFCILARGSNSKDAWPKSPRGAAELGNTRDDLRLQSISMSNDSAVVLVFEDAKRTQSKTWWVLRKEFLEDLPVVTEYTVLRRCQLLAEFMHAQESANSPEVLQMAEARPPGAVLFPSSSLEATAEAFFNRLGAKDSALVLLDENFSPLPVAADVGKGDAAEQLSNEQLDAFTRGAERAAWKILRRSMGWVAEFTSKIVARLQVLHNCKQLLPALSLTEQKEFPTSLGWPCREGELFFRDGPLVHFVLRADLRLDDLSCDPMSPMAGACCLIARSCIAGLWRAHHAWDRCRLSFAFNDGAVVTVTRRFKGRFQGKRQMEYHVLREMRRLVDHALQLGPTAKTATPGRKAVAVQLKSGDLLPDLPYRTDGTIELHLHSHCSTDLAEADPRALRLAEDILQVLWDPIPSEDGQPSGPSCMILLCYLGVARCWDFQSARHQYAAGLRGCSTEEPFAALTSLQSALLGEDGAGVVLLSQLLHSAELHLVHLVDWACHISSHLVQVKSQVFQRMEDMPSLSERPKWELSPVEQLKVAAYRRDLGNAEMRQGHSEKAFTLYKNALFMVEFDEDFEEHSDEEDAYHHELPPLEDVHAERVRCLSNLAAASLAALDETREEPSIEGYAGKAKRYSQRALKLKKDDAKLWFRKGRAELLLGEISTAATSFAEAARMSPQDPNVRKYLQEARAACQAERNACRSMEKAMSDPSSWVDDQKEMSRNQLKPKKEYASEEERKADIEYNKRQLLYHFEKAKVKPESDCEEPDDELEVKGWTTRSSDFLPFQTWADDQTNAMADVSAVAPQEFLARKRQILASLDRSPKGSLDAPIVDFLNWLNEQERVVTTSSCSGRIAIFHGSSDTGNSKGGQWLLASHSTVENPEKTWEEIREWLQSHRGQDTLGTLTTLLLEPFVLHAE